MISGRRVDGYLVVIVIGCLTGEIRDLEDRCTKGGVSKINASTIGLLGDFPQGSSMCPDKTYIRERGTNSQREGDSHDEASINQRHPEKLEGNL